MARLRVPKPNQSSFARAFWSVSGRKVMMPGNTAMTAIPATMIQTKGHEARKISSSGTSGAALFSANNT